MRSRLVPLWVSCILMLIPLGLPAQAEGLQTNALSGVYNRDQRFWFSATPKDRLLVSLDGIESENGALLEGVYSLSGTIDQMKRYEKPILIQKIGKISLRVRMILPILLMRFPDNG